MEISDAREDNEAEELQVDGLFVWGRRWATVVTLCTGTWALPQVPSGRAEARVSPSNPGSAAA